MGCRNDRLCRTAAVLCALASAFALGACGSAGRGGSDTSQVAKIKRVITESATSKNPAACRLLTQRFLEQTTAEKGAAAGKACTEDTRTQSPATSVGVSHVRVSGDTAAAHADLKGGDDDGQSFDLSLIRAHGQWKLDRITAVKINRAKFDAATKRDLLRGPDSMNRSEATCAIGKLRTLSDARIERAIVAGDPNELTTLVLSCLRRQVEAQIVRALRKQGLTRRQTDCAIARLRTELSDARFGAMIQAAGRSGNLPAAFRKAIAKVIAACGGQKTPAPLNLSSVTTANRHARSDARGETPLGQPWSAASA